MQDPQAFFDHVQAIQDHLSLDLNEADTRAHLVDPVLRILGYQTVRDVRHEVPIPATKEFIDYQLLVDGEPRIIVEAKAVRHGVLDQHAAQCVQYASVLGVRWCLITNGSRWALFDAHAKGPLAAKRVVEVRIDGDQATVLHAWQVLRLFSKEEQARPNPLTDLLIQRVVADELSRPDSPAIEALRRAVSSRFGDKVSGSAVVSVLRRVLAQLDQPVAGAEAVLHSGTLSRPDEPRRPPRRVRGPRLADLVAAGLIPDGAPLEARVRGVSHVGHLRDGGIEVNGIRYPSPSAASIAVGEPPSSLRGWTDWHYRGETLDELRRKLTAGQGQTTGSSS